MNKGTAQIREKVVPHLIGDKDCDVDVYLEILIKKPDGFEDVIRKVGENNQFQKFEDQRYKEK